jgi:hypothetical protein
LFDSVPECCFAFNPQAPQIAKGKLDKKNREHIWSAVPRGYAWHCWAGCSAMAICSAFALERQQVSHPVLLLITTLSSSIAPRALPASCLLNELRKVVAVHLVALYFGNLPCIVSH